MQKTLQHKSQYNKYDLDGDGEVSDGELTDMEKLKKLKETTVNRQPNAVWLGLPFGV
jgi:Ca2+-binding EF-hand superfamily protein